MLRFLWVFAIILGTESAVKAQTPAQIFQPFFQDLQKKNMVAQPMQVGVSALSRVMFLPMGSDVAAARYVIELRRIELPHAHRNPATGLLKPLAQIGWGDTGMIIHELWHSLYWGAWMHTAGGEIQRFRSVANSTYTSYPASVREEIHEEAWGLFIQEVARSYLFTRTMLYETSPEMSARLRNDPKFIAQYERSFTERVKGYFVDNSGNLIWSTIPLPENEKILILQKFFSGKITGKFVSDFPL